MHINWCLTSFPILFSYYFIFLFFIWNWRCWFKQRIGWKLINLDWNWNGKEIIYPISGYKDGLMALIIKHKISEIRWIDFFIVTHKQLWFEHHHILFNWLHNEAYEFGYTMHYLELIEIAVFENWPGTDNTYISDTNYNDNVDSDRIST